MKSIKTITCHNVYNYGASLQEYALYKYLKRQGFDVETINYNPDYLSNHYNFWKISNPKWERNILLKMIYISLKLPLRLIVLKRKKAFDKFTDTYIPTTKYSYKSNEELKNNLPLADVYICGSDQIWNPVYNNGKDPAFYLDFVPNSKIKMSYAASIATDHIPESLKAFVKEKLSEFTSISVREQSAQNLLEQIDVKNTTQVLDPVFLLDENEWMQVANEEEINKKYILVYDADKNPSIKKTVISLAKKYHWKIYTISPNIKYADKNYYFHGPDMFLTLIKNASFIISNSFHAVAFSIIFKKQFVVYERKENINARMQDIIELFDIDFVLQKYDSVLKEINFNIEYSKIEVILKREIVKSKTFLNKINE